MTERLRILDADCHVLEPQGLWLEYLEPEFRSRVPTLRPLVDRRPGFTPADMVMLARRHLLTMRFGVDPVSSAHVQVDGQLIWDRISDELWIRGVEQTVRNYPRAVEADFDSRSQVEFLREMGAERAYLYPTTGLWLFAIDGMEPALAAALVRAYNRWLRDFCAEAPGMLNGVGAMCRHDPTAMVEEVRQVASWGWSVVTLRPEPIGARLLSHPDYEPFWSECERLKVAVALHGGTHARLSTVGADRFHTRFAMHACSHPMEQMMALLTLVEGGVLERHPELRVAFLESGCGWLPYWLGRLDTLYSQLAWEVSGNVRMRPSDYFRRQCFISCEPGEVGLELVVDTVGEGCLLYGSDYPHIDHGPHVREEVNVLSKRLSWQTAQRILWDNPQRFYGTRS